MIRAKSRSSDASGCLRRAFAPRTPAGYFADPALRQRLDLLGHLTEYADLLLLIQGEAGVGKTALLEELLTGAGGDWAVCRISATPLTTRDQFLAEVAKQFRLDAGALGGENILGALQVRLQAVHASGQLALLAVDDAHALAVPVLDEIARLHGLSGPQGHLLRVVLLADPQLQESMQSPPLRQFRQRITHTLDVPPLSEEQTGAYLEFRLRSAGCEEFLPVDELLRRRVYQDTRGVPARIHERAPELLLEHGAPAGPPAVGSGTGAGWRRWARVLGLALLVIVAGAALLFQDRINRWLEPASGPPLVEGGTRSPLALPGPPPRPSPPVSAVTRSAPPPAPAEPPAASAEPPGVVHDPDPGRAAAPEPPPREAPPPEPPAPPPAPAGAPAAAAPPPSPSPCAGLAVRDRAWLRRQRPDSYTLQLLAVRSPEALVRLIGELGAGEDELAAFETRHQGGPWYVLLYGIYPDREAALAARGRLPDELRSAEPWPRSLASVHQQLGDTP